MNSDTLPAVGRMPPEAEDVLILLGVMAGVALIILLCALIFRTGDRKRSHHHHHHHHRKGYLKQIRLTAGGIKELVRQRRQRSHRGHRSLNPTLAQTGGLPPIRSPDQPPGSPSSPTAPPKP